jgi:hypothetical protein
MNEKMFGHRPPPHRRRPGRRRTFEELFRQDGRQPGAGTDVEADLHVRLGTTLFSSTTPYQLQRAENGVAAAGCCARPAWTCSWCRTTAAAGR